MSDAVHYEIERKFLIAWPCQSVLASAQSTSAITQTYLLKETGAGTRRVRKREYPDRTEYTFTEKIRVSAQRRIENEREITEDEYLGLLASADPSRTILRKMRYCIPYEGQTLEIDVYPFWSRQAVLEIELSGENQPIRLPDSICILREVTEDRNYTNAALALSVPEEIL